MNTTLLILALLVSAPAFAQTAASGKVAGSGKMARTVPDTSGTIIAEEDFEGGDFGILTPLKFGCSTHGTSFAVNTVRPHSGNYSAEFRYVIPDDQCASHQDTNAQGSITFDPELESGNVRAYFYHKTPEVGGTSDGVQRKIFYFFEKQNSPQWWFFLATDGTAGKLNLRLSTNDTFCGGSAASWFDIAQLDYDTWYSIEIRFVLNTPGSSNGFAEVWIDGVSKGTKSDRHFRGTCTTGVSYLNMGRQSDRLNFDPVDEYRYLDDLVVKTGYIGP